MFMLPVLCELFVFGCEPEVLDTLLYWAKTPPTEKKILNGFNPTFQFFKKNFVVAIFLKKTCLPILLHK